MKLFIRTEYRIEGISSRLRNRDNNWSTPHIPMRILARSLYPKGSWGLVVIRVEIRSDKSDAFRDEFTYHNDRNGVEVERWLFLARNRGRTKISLKSSEFIQVDHFY
jgi:hypothetical protein